MRFPAPLCPSQLISNLISWVLTRTQGGPSLPDDTLSLAAGWQPHFAFLCGPLRCQAPSQGRLGWAWGDGDCAIQGDGGAKTPFCPRARCLQGAGTRMGFRTASKSTGTARESRGLIQSSQPLCPSQPHREITPRMQHQELLPQRAGARQAQAIACLSSIGHAGLTPPKHRCRIPKTPSPWQTLPVHVGVSADHCWEGRHRNMPAPRRSNPSWHPNTQVEL